MPEEKKTNKVEVKFIMTAAQKKDLMKALDEIVRCGASDYGRALQLLSAEYFSGHEA